MLDIFSKKEITQLISTKLFVRTHCTKVTQPIGNFRTHDCKLFFKALTLYGNIVTMNKYTILVGECWDSFVDAEFARCTHSRIVRIDEQQHTHFVLTY